MSKTKISEFSSDPALNTDIDGINIAEGCAPSGINNAIRELMAQLKDWQSGTSLDTFNTNYMIATAVDINGGAIDGATIGGSTPAVGSFTQVNADNLRLDGNAITSTDTNGNIDLTPNGTGEVNISKVDIDSGAIDGTAIGASSASTGAFTTLSASSTATFAAGAVGTPSITTAGDTNTGIFFPAADTIAFAEGGAEAARIDSSGRMLIGSTTARANLFNSTLTAPLQVEGTDASTSTSLIVRNSNDTSGALLVLGKSRGTTVGSNTVIQSGDTVGSLNFQGNDGTEFVNAAQISAIVDGTPGANDMPSALLFSVTADGGNAVTERMRIDSSGNVGIGTSSPLSILHVGGGGDANVPITIAPSSGGNAEFRNTSGTGTFTFTTSNGATERARIDSSGNLLVGTTAVGNQNADCFSFSKASGYIAVNHVNGKSSGSGYVTFGYNGGEIGSITQNGTTAVAYNTSSDYRLKNITGPITTSGAYIDSLNPVEGTWKADGSTFVGLIAHEVQEVSRTTIATGEKDGEEMQGMDYSSAEIIANLIAEVKSLRQRLAAAGI